MDNRFIKPRVFLSHSKSDADFVRHLHADLQKCQIEPWIDEIEIRTGKPWLDVIFEDGIPTCDSVFVYLTDQSIQSSMVKKEIDVGIIQQLKDQRVAFLPYVNDEALRSKLRADIQALQVPVWNPANYVDVLPRFVAEVWRSFTERRLHAAVQEEQNRRLKAEIELERLTKDTQTSVFSDTEEADFKYVWKSMDYVVPVIVAEKAHSVENKVTTTRHFRLGLNVGSVLTQLIAAYGVEYVSYSLSSFVAQKAGKLIKPISNPNPQGGRLEYYLVEPLEIKDQLLMYGLLQSHYVPPPQIADTKTQWLRHGSYRYIYSERMYRFRYWLAYNKLLPNDLKFEESIEALEKKEE